MSATDMEAERRVVMKVALPWRLRWRRWEGGPWREYDRYLHECTALDAARGLYAEIGRPCPLEFSVVDARL